MEPYQNLASSVGQRQPDASPDTGIMGGRRVAGRVQAVPQGWNMPEEQLFTALAPLCSSVWPPGLSVLASSSVVEDGDAEVQERKTYTGVVQNSTRHLRLQDCYETTN